MIKDQRQGRGWRLLSLERPTTTQLRRFRRSLRRERIAGFDPALPFMATLRMGGLDILEPGSSPLCLVRLATFAPIA
jgi:hypothetical protein